jgi:hypothetical protein
VGKLPLEPIKQILKDGCNANQVSVEAIVDLRDFLEQISITLSKQAAGEMVKLNRSRERHGLEEQRRLPGWIIKKATNNVLSKIDFKNTGSRFTEIENPDGNTMSTERKAVKSAKEKHDDIGGDADGP